MFLNTSTRSSEYLLAVFKVKPSELVAALGNGNGNDRVSKVFSAGRPRTPAILERVDSTINSVVNVAEPLFQPSPVEILFQNYKPHESHEAVLTLRNNDKVRSFTVSSFIDGSADKECRLREQSQSLLQTPQFSPSLRRVQLQRLLQVFIFCESS